MEETITALTSLGLGDNETVVRRPWGAWVDWYRAGDVVLKGIAVAPGQRTSLQRHGRRAEIWRVIRGHGEDQGHEPAVPLASGHTYRIAAGDVHRIANTGHEPLLVVEMQLGSCSESDIERLADDYGRLPYGMANSR